MTENNADTGDTGDKAKATAQNVNVDAKNEQHMIPKSRFDQVIQQKKAAEEALNSVVDSLIEEVPENMRDIVPDLPPADKIKWIQQARTKGFFGIHKEKDGPDSKRPQSQKVTDYEGMSPQQKIKAGYKT